MKKYKLASTIILVFIVGIVGVGIYSQLNKNKDIDALSGELFGWKFPVARFPATGSGDQLAYSSIRDPGGISKGLPVRLIIPFIGVDSVIEDALITPDGRMDVPIGSKNVAWFALGPSPGQVGSAVIGGHFGITNGIPFVFYDLDKLREGDKIHIVDDGGDVLSFVVRSIGLFKRDDDATIVFTSNDGLAHLNLITCEGIWNKINDTYPERRVIFTDAIPTDGAVGTSVNFSRSLGVGTQGADVTELQVILEQKGFLVMPQGVAYGFFGPLTRAAVAGYQVANGIAPAVGYFGPLTRSRLISELAVAKEEIPIFPSTARVVSNSLTTSQIIDVLIRPIKSLYATQADGLVTSFLFVAIVFITFKIISRYKLVKRFKLWKR